jgi:hypothetical protein
VLRDQLSPSRRRSGVVAGAAACLLTVGIGASVGVNSATAGKEGTPGPETGAVIAVLDSPADAFPAGVDTDALIPGGLDRDSLQKLGSDGPKSFWTGTNHAGDICLITILDVRLTTAAACSPAAEVEANGLDLSASGDNHQPDYDPIVAILVPDSVSAEPIAEASHVRESTTPVEVAAEESANRSDSSRAKAPSYDRTPNPKKNPWKRHGSNLVVARQSEVPKDVKYEFGRKRGHSGPPISFHG